MQQPSDWRFQLQAHRGAWLAAAMFVVIFALYIGKHQAGWTVPVITTATNKGVLLAIVAMAQTLPVLTAGIDLSVGMVFVLANCLASYLVVGSGLQAGLGVVAVLATGALCGLVNGAVIVYGRLQPIITTLATGTVYYGISLGLRPVPGGDVHAGLAGLYVVRDGNEDYLTYLANTIPRPPYEVGLVLQDRCFDAVGNLTKKSDFSSNTTNAYSYSGGSCGGGANAAGPSPTLN